MDSLTIYHSEIDQHSEENSLDLGDVILLGLGDTVKKMRVLCGNDRPTVDLGEGVSITIEEQDAAQSWRERLSVFQGIVFSIVSDHSGLDQDVVCRAILQADGWTWTSKTLRTPLWMAEFDEVLHSVAIDEFEVLGWLGKSS